jgi:DNA-binding response OmpR family regulator
MNGPPSGAYILVLEDDQTTRELLEIVLTDEGYDARSASSVAQALAVAQEREPVLVLFDMLLQDQRGDDFVKAYRAMPGATARLIAVSGIAR